MATGVNKTCITPRCLLSLPGYQYRVCPALCLLHVCKSWLCATSGCPSTAYDGPSRRAGAEDSESAGCPTFSYRKNAHLVVVRHCAVAGSGWRMDLAHTKEGWEEGS
eukprot:2422042-Rhodomonas_salina.1